MERSHHSDSWGQIIAARLLERVHAEQTARRAHAERCRKAADLMAERLGQEPTVQRVVLFGSLAGVGGLVHKASDIDLAVEGLTAERAVELGVELERDVGLPVDLVRLETAGPSLRQRIASEGEVLYVAR